MTPFLWAITGLLTAVSYASVIFYKIAHAE